MTTSQKNLPAAPVDGRSASYPLLDRGASAVMFMVGGLFVAPAIAWILWGSDALVGTEPRVLVGVALLALVLALGQIGLQIRRVGGDVIRGNRDPFPTLTGMPARVARAHTNLLESLAPFAVAVLVAQTTGVSNRVTAASAVAYGSARVVHAVTYSFGITVIRSAAFYAGLLATVVIALEALRMF